MKKWRNCLKRSRIYFILILLLSVFTHCQFIIDNYFGDDTSIEPELIPYFEEGDTLVYLSNNKIDSFYMERVEFYAVGEDDGLKGDMGYERFRSSMIQLDCSDSCYKFNTSINPWEYWIYVYGLDYSLYKLRDYWSGNTLTIGKYKLKDLYKSYNVKADSITGKEISEVLYSKKYGVVVYELTNGEIFELEEECLEMLMARE